MLLQDDKNLGLCVSTSAQLLCDSQSTLHNITVASVSHVDMDDVKELYMLKYLYTRCTFVLPQKEPHSSAVFMRAGPVFCLVLGVSSDYAQTITGQVTEVTCPVIGQTQPELTPSKRQKTGPDLPHTTFHRYSDIMPHVYTATVFTQHNPSPTPLAYS